MNKLKTHVAKEVFFLLLSKHLFVKVLINFFTLLSDFNIFRLAWNLLLYLFMCFCLYKAVVAQKDAKKAEERILTVSDAAVREAALTD